MDRYKNRSRRNPTQRRRSRSKEGPVWDRDGVANEQEKRKKPTERLAADARPLAACEGKTRDLNWTAKNRRSELAAAYRLFASRLSLTQSQTGP